MSVMGAWWTALHRGATALLLTGCAPAGHGPVPADIDPAAYPPCADQPPPPSLPPVAGLTLPREATVFSVHEMGPLTQAEGVVALTPVEVRTYYEGRSDLELLAVEDERVEAEVLISDGTHRMFVKVQAVCATGSNFAATVGLESASGAVPTPSGTASPPP